MLFSECLSKPCVLHIPTNCHTAELHFLQASYKALLILPAFYTSLDMA